MTAIVYGPRVVLIAHVKWGFEWRGRAGDGIQVQDLAAHTSGSQQRVWTSPAKSNSLSSAAAASDRGNSQKREKIQSPKFTYVE